NNFEDDVFYSSQYFSDVAFDAKVNFEKVQFCSWADFTQTQFLAFANLSRIQFYSTARFLGAQFDSLAYFYKTRFHSLANFKMAQFHKLAYFKNAQFDSLADFSHAHFKSSSNFLNVQLPKVLKFDGTMINKPIDLTRCQLKPGQDFCYISLIDAPIEKLHLTYDNFRILKPDGILTRTHYQRLNSVYEKLLKNFKDQGYLSSYEMLDIEYQAFKYLQNPDYVNYRWFYIIWNELRKNWTNYGYNKEWILLYVLFFLLVFTIINWLMFPYLSQKVYPVPSINRALFGNITFRQQRYMNRTGLNFSRLDLAFYYTTIIFFGLKMSTEAINYRRSGVILIYVEYIVGLICLGYLANFIVSSQLIA
ncbi:MAG: pentapeptide repeat-containing protein, partial [Bacteroidota bacterium]